VLEVLVCGEGANISGKTNERKIPGLGKNVRGPKRLSGTTGKTVGVRRVNKGWESNPRSAISPGVEEGECSPLGGRGFFE